MHREWVHEDLAIGRRRCGYGVRRVLPVPAGRGFDKGRGAGPALSGRLNPLMVIFVSTLIVLITTLPLIIAKSRSHGSPLIVAAKLPELNLSLLRPHAKDFFYARLSLTQKNNFSNLVGYVADIIRSTRNQTIDAHALSYTIVSESLAAKYDPLLVASLIMVESSFRKHISSSVGALGLMQIKPSTGRYVSSLYGVKWQGPASLKDPQYNIQLGIAYLKYLEELFEGNMKHALIAYNWGPGNMMKALRKTSKRVPLGSLAYSRKVLRNHSTWRADLGSKKLQLVGVGPSRG